MAQDWQQEKEMSNAFWLKLILKLALKLPRWSVRLLLHPIVFFFILVAPKKRQASRHYLTKIFAKKGTRPKIWHIYKHFFWFASALLDRVYFLTNQQELFDISFTNHQAVIDTFAQHPGQFFISGHYGSVEALKAQAIGKDYEIKPVIKLDHNQTIVNLFKELNPTFYQSVIPNRGLETIFEIYENLKQGNSIALLADRPVGEAPTVLVDFLGDKIPLPLGVFEMIQRLPYPSNIFFSEYQGGNQYHASFQKFEINTKDSPEKLAQKFADILAQQCLNSPYNWFNFYTYWDEANHVDK